MARSTYVYVVTRDDGHLYAAFTVKRELVRWLIAQTSGTRRMVRIRRVSDGPPRVEPVDVTDELIEEVTR